MATELNLLVIEDNPADFLLLERHLRQHGVTMSCRRVQTDDDLDQALRENPWDAVFADYHVPGMTFLPTLHRIQSAHPDLPVILVSGSIGEERAADLLNAGVRDFVLKEHLYRLEPVLRRCLEEATERRRRREAELALERNEAKFRAYFEQAPIMLLVLDRQGRITDANPATEHSLGYPRTELRGLDLLGIAVADDIGLVQAFLGKLFAGSISDAEFRLHGKAGHPVWVSARAATFGPDHHVVYAENIDERKHAEVALRESEAQYRAVSEMSADGFWMLDESGHLLAVNDAYVRRSGYSRSELLTMHIADLEAQESIEEVRQHIEAVRRNGSDRFETRHKAKSGETWPAEVNASFWPGANGRYFGFLRDLTERKRTEATLQAWNAEMEQIMRFHVARQTIAAIAHELNQPLVAVSSYAEAALRMLRSGNPQPERLLHAIESSATQADRAGRVVRELLTYLSQDEIRPETFDLNLVVANVLHAIEQDQPDDLETNFQQTPNLSRVTALRPQVEKVIANLLENGIEAMREAGISPCRISVSVRPHAAGRMAMVTVQDNGPGVDTPIRHAIFEAFFSTKKKGLGMGLPISRAIIERHGGQLWVDASPESGAAFHFTLPFAP